MFISIKLTYLLAGMALALPTFTNIANTKFIDAIPAQPPTILLPLPTTLAEVRPTAEFDSAQNRNLLQAVQDGDIKAVRAALSEGADPNAEKTYRDDNGQNVSISALSLAVNSNRIEIAKVLIERGANVNDNDGYPLWVAAGEGYFEMVMLLLSKGADVNAVGDEGFTVLGASYRWGHTKVVEVLLKHGADPNGVTSGMLPLYDAVNYGNVEVVRLLIASGADVNAKSEGKFTPLCIAASNGNVEVVSLLIASGADVNAKSEGKFTPLCIAASNGNVEVVSLLIANGADVNAECDGSTPRAIAEPKGYTEIVNLLKQAGAQ